MKKIITTNPRLRDYRLYSKIEAGLALLGWEIKSSRIYGFHLKGASISLTTKGAWLVGSHIHPYKYANLSPEDSSRSRQLLLHKKELSYLYGKSKAKFLIIPTRIYWLNNKIKLEIAVAQRLKKWQKKEKIKEKDIQRLQARELGRTGI